MHYYQHTPSPLLSSHLPHPHLSTFRMYSTLVLLILGLCLFLLRVVFIVREQARASSTQERLSKGLLSTHSHGKPIRLLILLGSGGHTAEMLRLLQHLASSSHRDLYAPSQYLITAGDRMSEGRVRRFDSQPSTLPSRLYPIPRARKVKQSWLTTPFTTAWSFVASIRILWCLSFDVFLCNGPGTCVPLALLIFIPKVGKR